MPSTFQRHFTFKHPLFRARKSASGVWFENSVYYLWWEFLRRHEGYKKTCDNGGKGKYAKLYAHFGNVHGVGFKDWWTKGARGAKLFAEPPLPMSVVALSPEQVNEISEAWRAETLLVVAIPMTLRKRLISQKFNKLLKQQHPRRRGQRTFKESGALYKIACQHDIGSLQTALAVYDLRCTEPRPKLWDVARQLKLGGKDNLLTKDELGEKGWGTDAVSGKRIGLTVAASKKLRQAQKIIEGVGRGIFPAISTRKLRK